jgi:hypothetical protein
MAWAVTHPESQSGMGFAGWWFTFVSCPIFAGLVAIWIWWLLAVWLLLGKVSKLDLRLVANHPDGAGGLGFLEGSIEAYAPLVLALSFVLAGRWAHDVLYHGVHVTALKPW